MVRGRVIRPFKDSGKMYGTERGGTNMLRVDVPDTSNQPGFTRFLSSGAIYAINPVSEEVARQMAENLQIQPVNIWDVNHLVDQKLKSLQGGESPDFDF